MTVGRCFFYTLDRNQPVEVQYAGRSFYGAWVIYCILLRRCICLANHRPGKPMD